MKKRILSILLVLLMVMSMLPMTALAAEEEPESPVNTFVKTPGSSAVQILKSVSNNGDGTYKLSMDAYVTGDVVTTNPDPLDIVLVLDVSGSMEEKIPVAKEDIVTFKKVKNSNEYIYNDWSSNQNYWYSPDRGSTTYPITRIERSSKFGLDEYTYTYDKGNGETGTYTSSGQWFTPKSIYYKTVTSETQYITKIEALKKAVNAFIANTAEKNAAITDINAKHRISIVKFAGTSTYEIGNNTYEEGWNTYNYSQIVKALTPVDNDGANALTAEVNNITPGGATSADYGLNHANTVLSDSTRSKVVIFFTDGEPNHGNGFDSRVANDAIGQAKKLKGDGATVYSVGVFDSDTAKQENVDKFMNAVSSNYPNAESLSSMGKPTPGSDYYKTADYADDLTDIFGDIADAMVPKVDAGSSSVLTDTVSDHFTAPKEATAVTVEVYQASGTGNTPVWTKDGTFNTSGITASVNGQNISVTGFDYSANAVVQDAEGNWSGKKLVISFDITPNPDATWLAGANEYPTNVAGENNEANAGLAYGNDKTVLTESPMVLITAYTVKYAYDGTAPAGAPTLPADGVYLPGTEVAVAAAPVLDDYTFVGWTTEDVVIANNNKFSMPQDNVMLTGHWEPSTATINYVAGTGGSVSPTTETVAATGTAQGSTATANAGYYFDGWYMDAAYTEPVVSGPTLTPGTPDAGTTVTYYAKFCPLTEVTVSVADETVTYNGTTQTSSEEPVVNGLPEGYTAIVTGYTAASGKDAGTHEGSFTDNKAVTICNEDGTDVTAKYSVASWTAGKLTIAPIDVTIFAASDSKAYDTNPLTNGNYAVAEGNLEAAPEGAVYGNTGVAIITGETITATVEGSQTAIGSSDNVAKDAKVNGADSTNYSFHYINGTLTVTKATDRPENAQISADSYNDVYDGAAHGITVNGATLDGDTVYYSTDGSIWATTAPTRTDVQNAETIYVKVTNPNYDDATANATITITSRPITITADSASKTYDETALTKDSYTVTAGTLVSGQVITSVTITGSRTAIGSSSNVASNAVIMSGETVVTDNYDITYVDGTLTVTAAPVASLSVTKTANETKASVGDTISWDITVTNTGDVELYDVTLSDTLNAAGDATLYDANGRALSANFKFDLAVGNAATFTAKYTVKPADAGKTIFNTVFAGCLNGPKDEDTSIGTEIRPNTPIIPMLPVLNTEDHVAYIIGYADDTVRPENNITRAEVATIFFRLLSDDSRAYYWTQKNDYSDVSRGDWFNNAVSTLSNAGIITGYPDGTFRPNAPITRAEFAAIAARFSDTVYSGKNTFSDVPSSHWAARCIALAEHLGWVSGYPDGTFRPDKSITRAEAMTLINRVLDRAVDAKHMLPGMVTWRDNSPSAWYYEDVQEATNSHEYTRLTSVIGHQGIRYESWTKILPVPDWDALEKSWSTAYTK